MRPDDQHDLPKDGISYPADAKRLQSYIVAEQQLSQFQAPVFIHADNPHERLYVARLDGTRSGNDKTNPRLVRSVRCQFKSWWHIASRASKALPSRIAN